MFATLVHEYEDIMLTVFGYTITLRMEEIGLLLAGAILGGLGMAICSGVFIYKLYKVEDFGLGQVKMIRVNVNGESQYYVQFKTMAEAIQQVLLLSFSPICTFKRYTKRDERRTKRFLVMAGIVSIFLLCFAVVAIASSFKTP